MHAAGSALVASYISNDRDERVCQTKAVGVEAECLNNLRVAPLLLQLQLVNLQRPSPRLGSPLPT